MIDKMNYDLGSYMMRQCGSSWEYCNGLCNSCHKAKHYYTNTTTTGNPNDGTPRYLVTNKTAINKGD